MDNNGLSASDVALLDGGGMGGNAFMWIFGLLILMGMFSGGFNGFGGNGYDRVATQSDVQYTSQFGQILDGNRDLATAISNSTAQTVAAANQTFHDMSSMLSDKYSELQRDISGVAMTQANAIANQMQCCSDTKMLIQAAAANSDAVTVAQTQKILDAISGNRIADMQNQINQLQMANQMANVVRFPNSFAYAGGFFPPFMPIVPPPVSGTTTGGSTTG